MRHLAGVQPCLISTPTLLAPCRTHLHLALARTDPCLRHTRINQASCAFLANWSPAHQNGTHTYRDRAYALLFHTDLVQQLAHQKTTQS